MSEDQNRSDPEPSAGRGTAPDGLLHGFDGHLDRKVSVEYEGADPLLADGFDPFHLLRVLHRWRWMAVTTFVMIVTGSVIYTSSIVPIYEARVRVLIEPTRLNILNIEDVVQQDRSIEAQIVLLQSRWLGKEVMQAMSLMNPPPTEAAGAVARPFDLRGLWSILRARAREIGLTGPSVPTPSPSALSAENAQIDGFLAGLTVVSGAKGVIDIKYRSADPELAAKIANGIARRYIDQNTEARFAAIQDVSDWLAARLTEQRQKVDVSEQALQRFREQNEIIVAAGIENPVIARLTELSSALIRTKAARLEKEVQLNKIRGLRANPLVLQRQPQMTADPLVQELRLQLDRLQSERAQMAEKLQERHPDMIKMRETIQQTQAQLQVETERVIEAVAEDVNAATISEDGLETALAAQRQEALGLNRKSVELGVLEREVQSSRQIYDMLLQRARETSIAKDISPNQIRILDPADVPRLPVLPQTRRNLLLAVFAGLMTAVALVFGVDQLDNRVKTPDEIQSRLGLPFLGLIPESPVNRQAGAPGPMMTNGASPTFIEAMRSLRTNVIYSLAEGSRKTIVVTSANLNEGKTVIASNLAVAIAQAGERVLLIDADMRRPTLHHFFGIVREPGLSNLLVGNVKASEVVRRASIANLWVLPSGHPPPNPPELLGSQRFKDMLVAFRDHFDWVVIDAPPVMPVTDSCVLAHAASGVIFVVGAERVSRAIARRALNQLERVDARIIGGLLTRVDLKKNAYYYAQYYHPRYSEYAGAASTEG